MTIFMCDKYKHTIVITNRLLVQGDFLRQLEKVIKLHPHALILREKDLTEHEYEELAKEVLHLCKKEGVDCFIHTRTEIAHRLGCKNIHLSIPVLKSMSDEEMDSLHRDFEEISVSCHSMEDVETAVGSGATQIILGTIFETECKKGLKGKGVEFVREICKGCSVPVYAIGGINQEKLIQVMNAGAAGGCMMSGFMKM